MKKQLLLVALLSSAFVVNLNAHTIRIKAEELTQTLRDSFCAAREHHPQIVESFQEAAEEQQDKGAQAQMELLKKAQKNMYLMQFLKKSGAAGLVHEAFLQGFGAEALGKIINQAMMHPQCN